VLQIQQQKSLYKVKETNRAEYQSLSLSRGCAALPNGVFPNNYPIRTGAMPNFRLLNSSSSVSSSQVLNLLINETLFPPDFPLCGAPLFPDKYPMHSATISARDDLLERTGFSSNSGTSEKIWRAGALDTRWSLRCTLVFCWVILT